jgi:site-specific recombinase XerD
MKSQKSFAALIEGFFMKRLMLQRQASAHTICSYRDTFRLLLRFVQQRKHKSPSDLMFEDIDAETVAAFLDEQERQRGITARSRNLRLTAIRSFFRYAAYEIPEQSAQIQRVLAIPSKRFTRKVVDFLTHDEVDALLDAPDLQTRSGRRDYALLLVAIQTGLRLSELTGLTRDDVVLGTGAHVRVVGKGRKERCTPISKLAARTLKNWMREIPAASDQALFPGAQGKRLSADGVQYALAKHLKKAAAVSSGLNKKHITPHSLRHTTAMEMLNTGVGRTVIALWLGHESVETTQMYLDADLEMKSAVLAKARMPNARHGKYRPPDPLLSFLESL